MAMDYVLYTILVVSLIAFTYFQFKKMEVLRQTDKKAHRKQHIKFRLYVYLLLFFGFILSIFYNPHQEAKLPLGVNVTAISVSDRQITDRFTILKVQNILFNYNRDYWDATSSSCSSPEVTAKFVVTNTSQPLTLFFGSNWICGRANFGDVITNTLWHPPKEKELELRHLLEINN